ncbi:MAG: non-homologous end-joining DNA ligase [Candidatus Nanopelagicales bacterium]
MASFGSPIEIDVEGIPVRVSNPERPLFDDVGITKREMIDYYLSVGPGILRALQDRPTTLERWPGGVRPGVEISQRMGPAKEAFYQKRIPKGAPDWVNTARITFPSGRFADEVCPDKLAVIAWAANLGTITFHPWPVRKADVDSPDELRIDLDPQPGTDFKDAVKVAQMAHELLDELGYRGFPKTSGGRGIHIYLRVEPRWDFIDMRHAAIAFGRELERRAPDLVTTKWWKEERGEKIFVDYNQNSRDRTIASAYSIRPRPGAPVSTPVLWEELPDIVPSDFTVRTVPERFARIGDLQAQIDDVAFDMAPLVEMYERDVRDHGLEDMPYPPDYPKMEGEPLRVQPSRRAKPKAVPAADTPSAPADTATAEDTSRQAGE